MRNFKRLLGLASIFFIAFVSFSFAEDLIESTGATKQDLGWVWGEVVSIDVASNSLEARYLDFNEDEERQISFKINPDTTFEGVESVSEIAPSDTVSIDYIKDANAVNVAKNILVEKPELADSGKKSDAKEIILLDSP